MKQTKIVVLITMLIAIFLQIIAFCNSPHSYYEFGFAIGVKSEYKELDVVMNLIYIMLPIAFILFFTSGSVQNLTQGYGKLLLIRNYSKTKLIIKQLFKNMLIILLIVLFQCVASLYFNKFLLSLESGITKALIIYFVIILAIIMLQSLLELYTSSQNVNIIIIIYCFVSYYIVQVTENNSILKIFLFPSLMFGMQNGAVSGGNIYYRYLCIGVVLNVILMLLCVRKFKRTDIF